MASIPPIPNNRECQKLLEKIIFGKGCPCSYCRRSLKRSKEYYWCKTCRKKIRLKALTWLKGSKLSYQQIFLLILGWQKNAPPGAIKAFTGLSYTAIARWSHTFRSHLPKDTEPLDGVVEVDECYYGRKRYKNQKIVIGAIERELKRVRLKIIPDASQDELEDFVWEAVKPTSKLHTDANPGYYDLHSWGYGHELWNHSKGHFSGTNNIENVWSVTKRQIRRLYGQIRTNKLPNYLMEWEARRNYQVLFTNPETYLKETLFRIS